MPAGRFVSPAGVVVEMSEKAAASLGWKPEEKPKPRRKSSKSEEPVEG